MKKLILLAVALTTIYAADAQVLKRLGQRAKNKLEQKAGDKVDKQIDDAVDGKKKDKSESKSQEETADNSSDNSNASQTSTGSASSDNSQASGGATTEVAPEPMKAYSKYDFIPGEKVFAYEDFSTTDIGDFPQRWNTNGTAEVVTLNNKEGKWMKINKEAIFYPEFITDLPENFTLEFDLGVNQGFNSNQFYLNITNLKAPENFKDYGHYVRWQGDHTVHLGFRPAIGVYQGNVDIVVGNNGNHEIQNRIEFRNWNNSSNNFGHVSVWRQKERLRVYLNGQKLLDLPKGFKTTSQYNSVTFALYPLHSDEDYYLLGNIRLAVGAPDTRNKLITEGKFVTTGILFDVNKDVIKPDSYGTLKSVANVLNENKDVKVKIIGHTDSDGEEKSNLDLSKRRAAAVKETLSKEFGVDESRMEADGKGESQPADKNDSVTGKANNRRVEFIKL